MRRFFDAKAVNQENEKEAVTKVEHTDKAPKDFDTNETEQVKMQPSEPRQPIQNAETNRDDDLEQLEEFDPQRNHFESVTNTYGIDEEDYATRMLGYGEHLRLLFWKFIFSILYIWIHGQKRRQIHG